MPKKSFTAYYTAAYNQSDRAKRVGWTDVRSQRLRYSLLSLLSDFSGCSVLDVGCGLGDFYGTIQTDHNDVTYRGIDIFEPYLNEAGISYPHATFSKTDYRTDVIEKHDYVVASGLFGYNDGATQADFECRIKTLFDLSHMAIGFNCLSSHVEQDKQLETLAYYSPVEVLNYCLTLTPFVSLHHHYLPHDFTVYMYK